MNRCGDLNCTRLGERVPADHTHVEYKTPAELYALGYAQYEGMIADGMDIETVRHLAAGLGQDTYAIGARTALGVHEERLAR